jgi:hypothetical protein
MSSCSLKPLEEPELRLGPSSCPQLRLSSQWAETEKLGVGECWTISKYMQRWCCVSKRCLSLPKP